MEASSSSNFTIGQILRHYLPTYQFIIIGICSGIICLIGIIGNILTGIVLFANRTKCSLYILLLSLAIWDLVFLVTTFELFSVKMILSYTGYGKHYLHFIHSRAWPWMYSMRSLAQITAYYFIVGITLERFIAVTFPFKAHYICSKTNSFLGSICLTIISILYNLPRWFDFESVPIYGTDPNDNRNEQQIVIRYEIRRTKFSENPTYQHYYLRWGFFISTCFVPFVIMGVLNLMIYKRIREMHQTRASMTESESNESNLTRMICTLVSISLFVTLWCFLLTFWDTFVIGPEFSITYELSTYAWANEKLIVVLNSSINPFIYCWVGKQFKSEVMVFYFSRKKQPTIRNQSQHTIENNFTTDSL